MWQTLASANGDSRAVAQILVERQMRAQPLGSHRAGTTSSLDISEVEMLEGILAAASWGLFRDTAHCAALRVHERTS
jgi:hypothetical protein